MENLSENTKPAPPIQITEDIQSSLSRLGMAMQDHVESGRRIGRELLYLKKTAKGEKGAFAQLVEWAHPGLNSSLRAGYMRIASDENGRNLPFCDSILIELYRTTTPDSAREEATQHDKLTVKQSKELSKANKRIEELKLECKRLSVSVDPAPDLNNLIPEISKLFRGGSIVLARAEQLSTLDHKYQNIYLQEFHSKEFYRKEADRAKTKVQESMDMVLKAIEEKEAALVKLEEAAGTTESGLIIKHEKELKALREDALAQARKIRNQAEKQASELHTRLNKEKIERAHKDLSVSEKAKRQAQEKASAAHQAQGELELKIKKLEEQLEVNNPTNVDLAMEKQVQSVTNSVMFVLKQLRNDMLTIGGGMDRSISAVEALNEGIAQSLSQLVGDSEEIITITGA